MPYMPNPGQMLAKSPDYDLPYAVGIKFDPANPLKFTFIVDKGKTVLNEALLRSEGQKIVRYFLAALTIPEADLWVNLSPYEQNRIVPDKLSVTDLGRDMLGEDYVLKQMAASLTYPETEAGRKYWGEINNVGARSPRPGRGNPAPTNSFNKIWIMPGKIHIYEEEGKAYIDKAQLKVMMEEDYVASSQNSKGKGKNYGVPQAGRFDNADAFKKYILPLIEKEVNTGKNFAQLRQLYYSIILASWFKEKLKNSFLGEAYFNKRKVKGVDTTDPEVREQIYQEYLAAFKKGAYNYVKREYVGANGRSLVQKITRRAYFSGGENLDVRKATQEGRRQGIPPDVETGRASINIACGTLTTKDHPVLTEMMAEQYDGYKDHLSVDKEWLNEEEVIKAVTELKLAGGLSARELRMIKDGVRSSLHISGDVEILFTGSSAHFELYHGLEPAAYAAGHSSARGTKKRIHISPKFLAHRGKNIAERIQLATAITQHELDHLSGKGHKSLPAFLQEAVDVAQAEESAKIKAGHARLMRDLKPLKEIFAASLAKILLDNAWENIPAATRDMFLSLAEEISGDFFTIGFLDQAQPPVMEKIKVLAQKLQLSEINRQRIESCLRQFFVNMAEMARTNEEFSSRVMVVNDTLEEGLKGSEIKRQEIYQLAVTIYKYLNTRDFRTALNVFTGAIRSDYAGPVAKVLLKDICQTLGITTDYFDGLPGENQAIACGTMTAKAESEFRPSMQRVYAMMRQELLSSGYPLKPDQKFLDEDAVITAATRLGKTGHLTAVDFRHVLRDLRDQDIEGKFKDLLILFTPPEDSTILYHARAAEKTHSAGHFSDRDGVRIHIPPLLLQSFDTLEERVAAVKEIVEHELGHLAGKTHDDPGMKLSAKLQAEIDAANGKDMLLIHEIEIKYMLDIEKGRQGPVLAKPVQSPEPKVFPTRAQGEQAVAKTREAQVAADLNLIAGFLNDIIQSKDGSSIAPSVETIVALERMCRAALRKDDITNPWRQAFIAAAQKQLGQTTKSRAKARNKAILALFNSESVSDPRVARYLVYLHELMGLGQVDNAQARSLRALIKIDPKLTAEYVTSASRKMRFEQDGQVVYRRDIAQTVFDEKIIFDAARWLASRDYIPDKTRSALSAIAHSFGREMFVFPPISVPRAVERIYAAIALSELLDDTYGNPLDGDQDPVDPGDPEDIHGGPINTIPEEGEGLYGDRRGACPWVVFKTLSSGEVSGVAMPQGLQEGLKELLFRIDQNGASVFALFGDDGLTLIDGLADSLEDMCNNHDRHLFFISIAKIALGSIVGRENSADIRKKIFGHIMRVLKINLNAELAGSFDRELDEYATIRDKYIKALEPLAQEFARQWQGMILDKDERLVPLERWIAKMSFELVAILVNLDLAAALDHVQLEVKPDLAQYLKGKPTLPLIVPSEEMLKALDAKAKVLKREMIRQSPLNRDDAVDVALGLGEIQARNIISKFILEQAEHKLGDEAVVTAVWDIIVHLKAGRYKDAVQRLSGVVPGPTRGEIKSVLGGACKALQLESVYFTDTRDTSAFIACGDMTQAGHARLTADMEEAYKLMREESGKPQGAVLDEKEVIQAAVALGMTGGLGTKALNEIFTAVNEDKSLRLAKKGIALLFTPTHDGSALYYVDEPDGHGSTKRTYAAGHYSFEGNGRIHIPPTFLAGFATQAERIAIVKAIVKHELGHLKGKDHDAKGMKLSKALSAGIDAALNADNARYQSAREDIITVASLLYALPAASNAHDIISDANRTAIERLCRAALEPEGFDRRQARFFASVADDLITQATNGNEKILVAISALLHKRAVTGDKETGYFLSLCHLMGIDQVKDARALRIMGLVEIPHLGATYSNMVNSSIAQEVLERDTVFQAVKWLALRPDLSDAARGQLGVLRRALYESTLVPDPPSIKRIIEKLYAAVTLEQGTKAIGDFLNDDTDSEDPAEEDSPLLHQYYEGACPQTIMQELLFTSEQSPHMPSEIAVKLKALVYHNDSDGEKIFDMFGAKGEEVIIELADRLENLCESEYRPLFIYLAKEALAAIVAAKSGQSLEAIAQVVSDRIDGVISINIDKKRLQVLLEDYVQRRNRYFESFSALAVKFDEAWQESLMSPQSAVTGLHFDLSHHSQEIMVVLATLGLDGAKAYIISHIKPDLDAYSGNHRGVALALPGDNLLSAFKLEAEMVQRESARELSDPRGEDRATFFDKRSHQKALAAILTVIPEDHGGDRLALAHVVLARLQHGQDAVAIMSLFKIIPGQKRNIVIAAVNRALRMLGKNPLGITIGKKSDYISYGDMTQAGHAQLSAKMRDIYGQMYQVLGKPREDPLSESDVVMAAVALGKTGGLGEQELNEIRIAVKNEIGLKGEKIFFTPADGDTELYQVEEESATGGKEKTHAAGHFSSKEGARIHIPPLFLASLATKAERIAAVKKIVEHELGHLAGKEHGEAGMEMSGELRDAVDRANERDMAKIKQDGGVTLKNVLADATVTYRKEASSSGKTISSQEKDITGLDFKIISVKLP